MDLKNLYKSSVENCFRILNTSKCGLSSTEAERRLKKYGKNDIEAKEESIIIKFFKKFLRPIQLLILTAAVLSYAVGHIEDFYLITCLLLINVFVEFFQEYKAENVIKMLKNKLTTKTKVLRDGKWVELDIRYLVPGDVIKIKQGDVAPADVKVIESYNLQVDESMLTGESLPVEKKKDDVIYAGSIVKTGEGVCLVIATGEKTYYGKVITSLGEIKHESVVEKFVFKVGEFLIKAAIVLIAILSIYLLLKHHPIHDILLFSLTLAVASIPAALPVVLSVVASLGVLQLSKKQVLVRRLSSLEDLASIEVFLSDKTGTLTENKIKVAKIVSFEKNEKEVLKNAVLCSLEEGDPIDEAIKEKAKEEGLLKENIKAEVISYVPPDSERKRATVTLKVKDGIITIVKGAPEKLLSLSSDDANKKTKIKGIINELASHGYRTILVGVNKGNKEEGLKIIGVIALWDPPRKEAKYAVESLKKMGVIVKLVTGDHAEIAKEIARKVGIGDKVITKEELDKMSDEVLIENVEKYDVFAEVFPSDKLRIVQAFRKKGYVTSVMGDGVNDVPALKQAEVGITVNNATDAARHAADIVLTKPGIHVVLDAIREGRKIYERLRNYVVYRISENIRLIGLVATMTALLGTFVLTPVQLLLLAILNDIPILAIAIDKVKEPRNPASFREKKLFYLSLLLGTYGVFETWILYLIITHAPLTLPQLQTIFFLKLVISGHFLLLCVRTKKWWFNDLPHPILLTALLSTELLATILVATGTFVPKVELPVIVFVWCYCIAGIFVLDAIKQLIESKIHYEN